jgi:hypothetical protein
MAQDDYDEVELSHSAQRACARAAEELRPFARQQPLGDLVATLLALASPRGSRAAELATSLTDVAKAARDVGIGADDLADRARLRKATMGAQERYLDAVSPAAAAAWRRGRRAA